MAPIFTGNKFGFGSSGVGRILNGLTATGGIISNFVADPGATYRTHVFTSPGTFTVSSIGDYPATVEYVVVAGGGGGGGTNGPGWVGAQGGSAGGMSVGTLPITTTSYSVTVGPGGIPAPGTSPGGSGSPSSFGPISSSGGAGGGPGQVTLLSPPTAGRPGGDGAGGGGNPGLVPYTGGAGGIGLQVPVYFRNSNSPVTIGTPGPAGAFYLAGGGGGGGFPSGPGTAGNGGAGGGGRGGGDPSPGVSGTTNTGGGGGGAGRFGNTPEAAGGGGTGIVIISYQV